MTCRDVRRPNYADSHRYAVRQAGVFFEDLPQAKTWRQKGTLLWHSAFPVVADYALTRLLAPRERQCD